MPNMPSFRDLDPEDQARYRDLAQAISESIASIDRNEFKRRGLRLREGADKSRIVYIAMAAGREKSQRETEIDYIARRLMDFLTTERRTMAKVVGIDRRKEKIA